MDPGQFHHTGPAPGFEGDRGGKMALGRDAEEVDGLVLQELFHGLRDEPSAIHGHGMEVAGGAQGLPEGGVAGIFHCGISSQGGGHQAQSHGRAPGDEQVLRRDPQAAALAKILGQAFPEGTVAPALPQAQQIVPVALKGPPVAPGQGLLGRQSRIGKAIGEILHTRGHGGDGLQVAGELEGGCLGHQGPLRHLAPGLGEGFGWRVHHVGATAWTALHPALQFKLPQGGHGHMPGEAQFLGQGAGAGHGLAGLNPSLQDLPRQHAHELQGHRLRCLGVQEGARSKKGMDGWFRNWA